MKSTFNKVWWGRALKSRLSAYVNGLKDENQIWDMPNAKREC
jgi:hypothetical protein